ncbi:MAG: hypothetical protein HYZ49_02170 [Chloroflexi bacterium]|nr:hypothetical protein [Chloroflexota bacterium]
MTDSVATASEETPAAPTPPEVPPEYISPPPPEPAFTPPPPPPLYTPPQPSYSPPAAAPAGAKDRTIALVLEVLPGVFGFLGIGWMYSGNIAVGLAWLLGVLVWNVIGLVAAFFTVGFSFCCTVPLTWALVGVSTYFLNEYTKQNAGMFGQ